MNTSGTLPIPEPRQPLPPHDPTAGLQPVSHSGKTLQPLHALQPASVPEQATGTARSAADEIRSRLDSIYGNEKEEPSASAEMRDSVAAGPARSKHQQFMYDLSLSGKSLADIQTAWHAYYNGLNDEEKHEVWQDFYQTHGQAGEAPKPAAPALIPDKPIVLPQPAIDMTYLPPALSRPIKPHKIHALKKKLATHRKKKAASHKAKRAHQTHAAHPAHQATLDTPTPAHTPPHDVRAAQAMQQIEQIKVPQHFSGQAYRPAGTQTPLQTMEDISRRVVDTVRNRRAPNVRSHINSLLFGLGTGTVVVIMMLFGLFNERVIAPFITPSRNVSATPIIVDPNKQGDFGPDSKVIIPKINVEVPVVYDAPSTAENDVQAALERGVVHYTTTPSPGEQGNSVIVGHSSNNILNKGKYKFAFVLLSRLEPGDLFILQKDGKQYVYKVFDKKIVKPEDVGVLTETPRPSMATLITCDPPGTVINRLIVQGEQISPDPAGNVASTAQVPQAETRPQIVPGNSPSVFQRLWDVF
jgi:LPXTG-site transpeptidase (sortase) family protein